LVLLHRRLPRARGPPCQPRRNAERLVPSSLRPGAGPKFCQPTRTVSPVVPARPGPAAARTIFAFRFPVVPARPGPAPRHTVGRRRPGPSSLRARGRRWDTPGGDKTVDRRPCAPGAGHSDGGSTDLRLTVVPARPGPAEPGPSGLVHLVPVVPARPGPAHGRKKTSSESLPSSLRARGRPSPCRTSRPRSARRPCAPGAGVRAQGSSAQLLPVVPARPGPAPLMSAGTSTPRPSSLRARGRREPARARSRASARRPCAPGAGWIYRN